MTINAQYKVTAVGAYAPEKILTNLDLEKLVDTNDEWIVKRTGIRERHIAAEGEFASDMAIRAVQNMIDETGANIADTDLVIATALVPDHMTPSISALVAGHFGLKEIGTFDLHAACSGFAYALVAAISHIASGLVKKVLLISAETLSKATDYTDRGTCILFGDAAVAMLIEKSESPRPLFARWGTDGDMAEKVYLSLTAKTVNGTPVEKERLIWQNGQALYTYVVKAISEQAGKLLNEAGLTTDDIDWLIPHSANLRMIDALRERIGIDKEKLLTSAEWFGNTSSASIPLAISLAIKEGKVKRGDKILIYGFGGGLTHAGAIFEW